MTKVIVTLLVVLGVAGVLIGGSVYWWIQDTTERRREVETELEDRMEALHAQEETRKTSFAQRHEWPWPLPAPTLSVEEALEAARPEIQTIVNERHPPSTLESIVDDAEEKYGLYRKGDEITFHLRGGVGVETTVSGTLYNITDERIQVDRRWFNKDDLPPTDRIHFDPVQSQRRVRAYVQSRMDAFREARGQYRRRVARKVMVKYGYAPLPEGGFAATDGEDAEQEWIPVEETLDILYDRWLDERRAELAETLYTERGFVWFKGRWMRPNPWFRILRAFFAE